MKEEQSKENPHGMAPILDRNIRALLDRRAAEESNLAWQGKIAVVITRFTGSMRFVVVHIVIFGAWIAISKGLVPGVPRFDPTLVVLAMAASVEAIFLSTFILITQNRMMAQADRRADLNLQISLLAEHEITRLISMTREIARRMGIKEAQEPELEALAKDVKPEQVLERIDEHEKELHAHEQQAERRAA
jgi:uncharacterized membrane protein